MFENDYIMRTIHDMVRMIVKLLFGIDPENKDYELEYDADSDYQTLIGLVQNGNINEAENMLYDMTENCDMEYLKVGLLFYEKINEMDNSTLSSMDYSREEVTEGIRNLLGHYGYSGLADGLK